MDNLEAYRSLMLEYGHRSARLWATEFGWATWEDFPGDPPEPWMVYNTPDNQLSYTVRAFEIGQERSYMGPMFLWNLNFANPATVENRFEAAGYSLLFPDFNDRNNLQVRPLYHRLTTG
jgi:hypothetical protein